MAIEPLAPAWNAPGFSWGHREATHLLNRAGFGGTNEDIDRLVELGPERSVDSMVHFQNVPDPFKPLEFGPLTDPRPAEMKRVRRMLKSQPIQDRRAAFMLLFGARNFKLNEMRFWWLDRMVRSPRPLEEKMTLLWHGLFVSSFVTVKNVYHLYAQNQLFRAHATGNLRALTLAVSKDCAMLQYLNNNLNRKQHPNENYARELMELFTLGIGNYTEEDVRQAARAWTGWTFVGDHFVARPAWHDFGRKTFLGHEGDFDGTDVVDIIFRQPAASTHFAGRLLKFFAVDDPPAAVVNALAATLRQNDFEVAPTLHRLFSSHWFYSDAVVRRLIKSPVELIAASLRQLDAPMPNAGFFDNTCKLMGQSLFAAPNVKGWPFGREWINTSTLFVRYNLPAYLVTGRLSPAARALANGAASGDVLEEFQNGWDPSFILARHNAFTADAVVDAMVSRLIQNPIRPAKRTELIALLDGGRGGRNSAFDPTDGRNRAKLLDLTHVIMSMPEYQLC